LRAYHGHRLGEDLLADPGKQDLTAHVNFSALQIAGESGGLRTVVLEAQRRFLTSAFERTLAAPAGFPAWTSERLRQFQTLTHPEHLGRSFQVLALRR
jgi:SAM-dependent MidA family methyltransferase